MTFRERHCGAAALQVGVRGRRGGGGESRGTGTYVVRDCFSITLGRLQFAPRAKGSGAERYFLSFINFVLPVSYHSIYFHCSVSSKSAAPFTCPPRRTLPVNSTPSVLPCSASSQLISELTPPWTPLSVGVTNAPVHILRLDEMNRRCRGWRGWNMGGVGLEHKECTYPTTIIMIS